MAFEMSWAVRSASAMAFKRCGSRVHQIQEEKSRAGAKSRRTASPAMCKRIRRQRAGRFSHAQPGVLAKLNSYVDNNKSSKLTTRIYRAVCEFPSVGLRR
jgi:hypothetical protein